MNDDPLAPAPTILVVDDRAANRQALAELLDDYRVIEAIDGAEALRLAAEHTPDLVLLDVMMPGMDGFEVCRRLRAEGVTAEVPVLLVTALDDQASRLRGIQAGADDFITKPFNRAELGARVRTITRLNRYARLHRERARLLEADRRIREQAALIDLDPDAIFVLGLDQRVRLWNRGAEQLYGWSAAEALGRVIGDLLRTPRLDRAVEAERRVRDEGAWRGELAYVTRQGATVFVESRWTLLSGEDARILVVDRDITEKKRDEERFLRAQRLESLGALAGGIVHDLNNVLAPMLMATELLRTDPQDPEAPRWIEMINGNSKRGAEMVKQILSFVRGSGTGKESVQLRHLIRDLHRMIRDTFPASIDCLVQLPDELWPVTADATQIYQVLLNLAVNARDAMPGGGRLVVQARNVEAGLAGGQAAVRPGPYVAIEVADSGVGIPAEHFERLFDPFFTTKAPGVGTGLGLATVRQVVDAHGGTVEVQSTVGQGTRFCIYLPAALAPEVKGRIPARGPLPYGRDELVLVADDEAAVREITKATLESYGYRVALAGDGSEAVARYTALGADIRLLLTDLQMPHMDGLSAIRAIRLLSPQLPVIAVSGSPEQHDAVLRSDVHVQGILNKPLTAEALLSELARALHA